MSNLISGRTAVSSSVPAHIAERVSDRPFDDEDEYAETVQASIEAAKDAILEGDVRKSWARDDYAYELVDLVHHLYSVGATRQQIGDAAAQWLRDMAERQAKYEIEMQS